MDGAALITLEYFPLPPIATIGITPPYTRVLTLLPGNYQVPLSCTLELLDVENPQYSYEALSYVWGQEQCPTPLYCNNGSIKITSNLDQALRNLRHASLRRRLWVDAVCINQADLAERARQVSYMRLVYKHATRTVIWLGPETPTIATAFAFIKEIYELVGSLNTYELVSKYQNDTQSLTSHEEGVLEIMISFFQFRNEEVEALKQLLASNYFERVWCLQEVIASATCIAQSGHLELDFNHILAIIPWVLDQKQIELTRDTLSTWSMIERRKLGSHHAPSQSQPDGSLGKILYLLMGIKNFHATDPRDRIFALLGISDEGLDPSVIRQMPNANSVLVRVARGLEGLFSQLNSLGPDIDVLRNPALKADYTRSTRDTYRDFARYCMRRHPRYLDVLSHVQHQSEPTSGYPSWVPKFDEVRIASFFSSELFLAGIPATGRYRYFAEVHDNPLRPDSVFRQGIQQSDLLQLNGFRVDEIEVVSNIITQEGLSPENVWTELFNFPLLNDIQESLPYYQYSSEPMNIAFLMTLVLGGVSILAQALIYGAVAVSHNRFEALEQAECLGKADLLAWLQQQPSFSETMYSDLIQKARMSLQPGDSRRFLRVALANCLNRRCYRTRSGIIGLGPKIMRPGDSVVVLFGGRLPFVIRQQNTGSIFIGDTYICHQSIMHGQEAVAVKSSNGRHRIETLSLS